MTIQATIKCLLLTLLIPMYLLTAVNAQVIVAPESPDDLQPLPHNLNMDNTDIDWEGPTFFPFSGAALERVPNPDKSGLNETDFVLQNIKAGGDPWAGFFYHLEEPLTVTDASVFRMKVWSNIADVTALLKLELKQFPDVNTGDLFADVTATGEWLQLEWNLSELNVDPEAPWDRVVIIMDIQGGSGSGGDRFTWYLDDFVFEEAVQSIQEPPGGDVSLLQLLPHNLNMDNTDVDWDGYTFFPFSGPILTRIANPDKSGLNETDFVLEYVKPQGSDPWAGYFYELDQPVTVTDETVFRMKVWSSVADINAVMKFEENKAGNSTTGDLVAVVTEAGQWSQMEWNLSEYDVNPAIPWHRVVIIMDFPGEAGSGGERYTWYLDDFVIENVATSIDQISSDIPQDFQLKQNYPNPFNPTTIIEFGLAESSLATLEVYNMLGQKIAVLASDQLQAGWHRIQFDASALSSGTYLYRLQAGDRVETRKLTLIK